MQYTVSKSEDESYIILKYHGDITREIAFKAAEDSHALGRVHGINRFLVDGTEAKNIESILNNYKFAYDDVQQADIDSSACVALLVRPDDKSHDFVETSLRNAGFDVTLFRDRDEAINHLLSSFQTK